MEEKSDKEEILEREWEIMRRWGTEVDEDLTIKKRKARWRIVKRARLEKAKG